MFSRKVPYVAQVQESECGLCCVSMVMGYYGEHISVKSLSKIVEVGRDGVSLNDMKGILERKQYEVKLYEVSTSMLDKIEKAPLILYWNNSHFVVLESIRKNEFVIVDPNIGRMKLKEEEFKKFFSNIVLLATPKENKEYISEKENYFKVYTDFFKSEKKIFLLLLFISILSYAVTLVAPNLMRFFTEYYENKQQVANLRNFLWIILAIFSFLMIYTLRSLVVIKFSAAMDKSIYIKVINKMFHVPYSFFLTRNSSDLMYRLGLLKTNREYLINTVLMGLIDFGMVITVNIMMFYINPALVVYTLLASFLMGVILVYIRKIILKNHKLEILQGTKLQSLEYETMSAMFTVKAGNQESFMNKLLNEQYVKSLEFYKKRTFSNDLYSMVISAFSIFGPVCLFLVIIFVLESEISIGKAIFGYTLLGIYFSSLGSIFTAFNVYGTLKNNLERISDILEHPSDTNRSDSIEINEIETIEFKDVYFKYPGQKSYVLKNLNFTIHSGEKVAFVGKTGSGKSTIIGLILGLYSPNQGEILINGYKLEMLDKEKLKSLIGFVPQEPFIFNKSIKENIVMNQDIPMEKVEEVCRVAQIYEEIHLMPMKYETVVSESGQNISGGQKQRIILARSLVNNPELIILDEATSSLDNLTEKAITSYFKNNNKTQIVIAHRLSTILNSDTIFILEDGVIMESGSHEYLLVNSQSYRELNRESEVAYS
ncbi:peptidase domain-containing ABC transporter [Bacillus massilinigeriensis]|uniref:peptidase domain-containing ABC transporter n=1 Tax=Bacillus mediterraneensis TaxID=1805474 RepID=UPI0008F8CA2C|nr:peptidase domain-containing ABC transporter [Bacillus mediterraneensis]